ncbi:MAG TPA: hypothetical protein VD770_02525, partial [Coxiellaceae bacterium]|nr:hypothetical protein [Coxiellaceae bacterium]
QNNNVPLNYGLAAIENALQQRVSNPAINNVAPAAPAAPEAPAQENKTPETKAPNPPLRHSVEV